MVSQVCHELTPENRVREQRGLGEAMKFFKTEDAAIITFAQRDAYVENGRRTRILPAWEFLEENKLHD